MIIKNAKNIYNNSVSDMSFDISHSLKGNDFNLHGNYIVPAFVDTHIHGCFGFDTSDGTVDAILGMAKRLPEFGVGAFMPTTMTISVDDIYKVFDAVSKAKSIIESSDELYADIIGIHLEGPFLSPKYAGVQSSDCLKLPDANLISDLESKYPNLLKIIDIAPELEGSEEFINLFKDKYVLSIAHSDADYNLAKDSINWGVSSVTHVLNAMNPTLKRSPGVLGAAFDSGDTYVEAICDGYHIDQSVLRMIFKLIPSNRMIVVSDAMRGAGMPDGYYLLGDTQVEVSGGRTYFGEGRGLAGSVTNLSEEVNRLFKFGIDKASIINAVTVNPLNRIGIVPFTNDIGSFVPDCKIRLNVLDENLRFIDFLY